jgi:hypothetical protein
MSRIRGIVVLLLTGIVGCNEPTTVNNGLDVSLSTDRQYVTPSTPATITVVIVNRSNRTFEMTDPRSYACMPPYSVATEYGDPVPAPSRGFCAAVLYTPVPLDPGATMTLRDTWSGEASDDHLDNTPLAPGRYRLAARVVARDGLLGSEPVVISVVGPTR